MTAPSNRTTYSYDNMGRTIAADASDTLDKDGNNIANISYTSYNLTGNMGRPDLS